MKRIVGVFSVWLVLVLSAHAASFDCAKARTKVEHLICGNAELSKLDDELAAKYEEALKDKDKAKAIRHTQRAWLKHRNNCSDVACVKQAYGKRLEYFVTSSSEQVTENNSGSLHKYHFRLTKGKGVPVCDAYLKRLNTTNFQKPPFCGRPENSSVKGFAKLNRVPLSPADVRDLFPIINAFMGLANQKNLDWADMNLQRQLTETGQSKLSNAGMRNLQKYLDVGSAKMWSYNPPIDVDNDGVPENIEIWQGAVLPHGIGNRHCGDWMSEFPGNELLRQPQVAFVITKNNSRLDVQKTKQMFSHPKGGFPIVLNGKKTISSEFRPIGTSIGIFEYDGTYYFDTFFDSWGDFKGKRRSDPNISNTLGVFLNKDKKTRQVCEFLMTDSNIQNEGDGK